MSMSKTLSYGTDYIVYHICSISVLFIISIYFLKRRKRTVLSMIGLVIFMAWQFEMSSVNLLQLMEILLLLLSLHCLRSLKFMRGSFGTNAFLQLPLMQSGC